jgi:hypothetical protein
MSETITCALEFQTNTHRDRERERERGRERYGETHSTQTHLSSLEPKRASAGVAMSVCTPMAMGTPPHEIDPSSSAKAIAYE